MFFKRLVTILAGLGRAATLVNCESAGKNTAVGAGIGAAAGAVAGAVIGHQTGRRNEGAAVGALIGGAVGAGVGNRLDKQAEELKKHAETRRTENGIVTRLKGDILFDTNKAALKPNADKTLSDIAQVIKKYPEDIILISGHTDATGTDKRNQALSEQRAQSVREKLVAQGVPANSIQISGAGSSKPVADNSSAEGRAKNRRVDIDISVDESKIPQDQKQ
jgi:outer membrane protein OmpA-like peptidoglycan-associated protein